jgi:deoxyinosine 3'endonuclease (endonuclease V)
MTNPETYGWVFGPTKASSIATVIEAEEEAVGPAVERRERRHSRIFSPGGDSRLRSRTRWGSELMAMRAVSKTVNPGSNPGSPA